MKTLNADNIYISLSEDMDFLRFIDENKGLSIDEIINKYNIDKQAFFNLLELFQ